MEHNLLQHWEQKVSIILLLIINLFLSIHLGVERAISLARQADIIAALSTEALRGTVRHLHPSKSHVYSFSFRIFLYLNQIFMQLDLISDKILLHNDYVHY